MKYLKLKTVEELPQFTTKDGKVKQGHITFAYFGDVVVNEGFMTTNFSGLSSFLLRKKCADKFGKNKDIPVVVYEVPTMHDEHKLHDTRYQLLQAYSDLLDQNFSNWNPHISSVDFAESPDLIHVVGIESDDGTFRLLLK